jgi:hypothetical protein
MTPTKPPDTSDLSDSQDVGVTLLHSPFPPAYLQSGRYVRHMFVYCTCASHIFFYARITSRKMIGDDIVQREYTHTIDCNEGITKSELDRLENELKKAGVRIECKFFAGYRPPYFLVTIPRVRRVLNLVNGMDGVASVSPRIEPKLQRNRSGSMVPTMRAKVNSG